MFSLKNIHLYLISVCEIHNSYQFDLFYKCSKIPKSLHYNKCKKNKFNSNINSKNQKFNIKNELQINKSLSQYHSQNIISLIKHNFYFTKIYLISSRKSFLNESKNISSLSMNYSLRKYSTFNEDSKESSQTSYRKMTPIEHILHRSDSYVGTTQPVIQSHFVAHHSNSHMQYIRALKYTPAFFKIFDEILVNAVDNHHRKRTGTSNIWISVKENGWISIKNDGKNIPIKKHSDEGIWIPELCFGHLLTGSNFDDTEIKFTAGRNGYGTKLCNIFSKEFQIEICDGTKIYKQTWKNNMYNSEKPIIEKIEQKCTPYIEVRFLPDFYKLNTPSNILNEIDNENENEIIGLLRRRTFDVAACNPKLRVHWNDKYIPIHSLLDYAKLFIKNQNEDQNIIIHKKYHPNWEIAIMPSLNELIDGGLESSIPISFVNGISTTRGGSHTQFISQQISKAYLEHASNSKEIKEISMKLTPNQILNNITIFINCQIENPTFDSQTKETLTNKISQFFEDGQIPQSFLKHLIQDIDIIGKLYGNALQRQQSKDSREMKRLQNKRRLDIPKLDDANLAGTNRSNECTLILTEGDSAKALAVSGLSVLGRDKYGVFPLRGKPLNVKDLNKSKIDNNEELKHIRKILALEYGVDYSIKENRDKLRYGKVMLMCDQDYDGSHIKGLFINYIHTFWPQLLESEFLEAFQTPLLKVNPGTKKELCFYSIPEFEQWKKNLNHQNIGHVKYYKGLGTSTSAEAKDYFRDLEKHRIQFVTTSNPEIDFKSIELAFGKESTSAQDRKEWLNQIQNNIITFEKLGKISFHDFVNHELIQFSQYSNERGIPNLIDGLKPSQRKILYACLKRNLKQEIKVSQLSGYVSEQAAYHHGEASLHSTIVNMAQNYVGSNNIPLLYPSGQFGTRLNGGKDHASARYIFTRLNYLTRFIFHKDDDYILDYQEEDSIQIEPTFYVPIIPMVLVNGAEGLGTGWSTYIPCFSWRQIIEILEDYLNDKSIKDSTISCYFEGFKGNIEYQNGKYNTIGIIKQHPKNKYQFIISELPIRRWTDDFKETLHDIVRKTDLKLNITSFSEQNTESKVHILLNVSKQDLDKCIEEGQAIEDIIDILYSQLKLNSTLSATNMTLFTESGLISRFQTPNEILESYIPIRLLYYEKRKQYLLQRALTIENEIKNKLRFIDLVLSNEVRLVSQPLSETLKQLEDLGFDKKNDNHETDMNLEHSTQKEDNLVKQYKYLLSLPISQLSKDNHNLLNRKLEELTSERKSIEKKSAKMMWKEDLGNLKAQIDKNGLLF